MENTSQTAHHPHIPLTIGTELLMEISDLKLRMRSELIGAESHRYLIIKLPDDELGFNVDAIKGSSIIIRYLHKGSIYGFKTSIINIIASPSKLIFLSYPTKVEEFKVRHNPRYECILPGSAKFGDETVEMIVIDISQKGCRSIINTTTVKDGNKVLEGADIDKPIEISVQLPGMEEKIMLAGVIKNLTKDTERVVMGVMFRDIKPEAEEKLNNFMSLISVIKPKD